jgi:hypothetical protein
VRDYWQPQRPSHTSRSSTPGRRNDLSANRVKPIQGDAASHCKEQNARGFLREGHSERVLRSAVKITAALNGLR